MKSEPLSVLLTDVHLDENYEVVQRIFDQAAETALRLNIPIFFLGDLFNNRKNQTLRSLLVFRNIIKKWKEIDFYAIPGNHDKTDLNSVDSFLDIADEFENFHLFKYADNVQIGEINCCFLPYFVEDSEEFSIRLERLKSTMIPNRSKAFLFCHAGITGVKNNDGSTVENNLKVKDFEWFDQVYIGHYHNASDLSKKIHYIGSSFPHNFGENNEKGVKVLFKDGSIHTEESDFPQYICERIEIDDKKKLREFLEFCKLHKNDYLRLIVRGERSKLDVYDAGEFEKLGVDVKFECNDVFLGNEEEKPMRSTVFTKSSIKAEFLKYCGEIKANKEQQKFGFAYIKNV